ncbi:MAG TPA: hypothetical protein VF727_15165 [Allosphingosinicella sp.]|jgi:flagellar basal-body rod protein FlgB
MDAISSAMIIKALDGLSARAVATAENIANAGSPNFRPLRVSFEQALASAAQGGLASVDAVRPLVAADASGAGVRVDMELATAAETSSRYAALVDLLGRQMQLESLAVSGNR